MDVARVTFSRISRPSDIVANTAGISVLDSVVRIAAEMLAVETLEARGPVSATIDAFGRWSSERPRVAGALNFVFSAGYIPRESYSPDGRSAATARDAAYAFGGRYESLLDDATKTELNRPPAAGVVE